MATLSLMADCVLVGSMAYPLVCSNMAGWKKQHYTWRFGINGLNVKSKCKWWIFPWKTSIWVVFFQCHVWKNRLFVFLLPIRDHFGLFSDHIHINIYININPSYCGYKPSELRSSCWKTRRKASAAAFLVPLQSTMPLGRGSGNGIELG